METAKSNNHGSTLVQWQVPEFTLLFAVDQLLPNVIKLAYSYPYRHNILGSARAADYVERLAVQSQTPGVGWYVAEQHGETVAAAHLSIYGLGDGSGHTLWKIRHPMVAAGSPANSLSFLFDALVHTALNLRPGTAKVVMFLSEFEHEVMLQAANAGFRCEGCFESYYRLGESCLVYGRTSSSRE